VSSYQTHRTYKLIVLPVRYTIFRHSQHLASRVGFDRNLIDCLNLKLKQKQKARRAKTKPPQSKGHSRIAKKEQKSMQCSCKCENQNPKTQCNAMQIPSTPCCMTISGAFESALPRNVGYLCCAVLCMYWRGRYVRKRRLCAAERERLVFAPVDRSRPGDSDVRGQLLDPRAPRLEVAL
jgi:hypothetical protein